MGNSRLCQMMIKTKQGNTYILFIVIIVLAFPEYHVFGLIYYVAHSDWLHSCSNALSIFLPPLSLLESSFLLSPE